MGAGQSSAQAVPACLPNIKQAGHMGHEHGGGGLQHRCTAACYKAAPVLAHSSTLPLPGSLPLGCCSIPCCLLLHASSLFSALCMSKQGLFCAHTMPPAAIMQEQHSPCWSSRQLQRVQPHNARLQRSPGA